MADPLAPERRLRALAEFDFEGQSEQSIREQWIYPLLQMLGYGLGTLNKVDIPEKLELRPPVRALGHKRLEVDYRPTVLGVGLWIIEAKRADEDPFDEQHVGQAWSYATDPRINVPLMMLTNGKRLAVFDLTQSEWDKPILELEHHELPTRFGELAAVLGARQVAEFVRERQLQYLRRALEAQVDEDVLARTVSAVEKLAEEARPIVQQNASRVYLDAFNESQDERRRTAEEIGVAGLAMGANGPYAPIGSEVDGHTLPRLTSSRRRWS